MALYLQMDGIDDRLQLPSMTFTEIVLEMSAIRQTNAAKLYVDARTGIGFCYLQSNTNGTDSWSTFNNVYVDGVAKTNNTTMIPENKKCTVRLIKTTAGTDDVSIFSTYSGSANNFVKGSLFDIKIYNGTTLQAHYNMSTGTVQDQSGNGRHATLTGGTWLDDGTGGTPTGTDGSTAFDSRQSIYQDSAMIGDVKNAIYQDAISQADTKQIAYADGNLSTDLRQLIYADQSQAIDTRITIYQDGASPQDTAQVLYEMSSAAFDTLQEIFNDGQVGSTPFDIRVRLYEDNSARLDTKQAVYDGGLLRYDVAQVIYESNTTVADVKAVIYADSELKADALQTIYADGDFSADTFQRILAEFSEYSEVVRIVLEITQRRREALAITQKHSDTLEIVQHKTIELHL